MRGGVGEGGDGEKVRGRDGVGGGWDGESGRGRAEGPG